ncbi:MAG TPA: DUF4402 domain-containing protein [Cyclobacteriaceae bacterium]
MAKKLFLKLSIVLLVTVLMCMAPSNASAQFEDATFTEIQPLNFGFIVPGAAGGTVTISDTGSVSVTGTITHLGGATNAQVLMDSCVGSGGNARRIRLTPGPLSGPGPEVVMTQLTCTSPGGSSVNNRCQNFSGTAGNDILRIGGTISVPAGQPAGVYNGTFDIIGRNQPPCP